MARKQLAQRRPLATLDDFIRTYEWETSRPCKEGADFFEGKGILPLTYHNPHLNRLTFLISWITWEGFLNNHYYAGITSKSEEDLQVIREICQPLDLSLNVTDRRVGFSAHGSWYARLFSLLGCPQTECDTKGSHKITVPSYLKFLTAYYSNISGEDKIAARQTLEAYIKPLLWCRLSDYTNPGRETTRISLVSNRDPDHGEENVVGLGRDIVKIFKKLYPKMHISSEDIHASYCKNAWHGRITLRQEALAAGLHYRLFGLRLVKEI